MKALKLRIKNQKLASKLQAAVNKCAKFLQGKLFKKLLIVILGVFIILASIDIGVFLYFRTQVLAYTQKYGIIVTKKEAMDRLLELPQYTQVTLQQLINDIMISQLVTTKAKQEKITIPQQAIEQRIKSSGQDPAKIDKQTRESLKLVMLMEKLAKIQEPTITDKQAKDFFNKNKELFGLKTFDNKTKAQIKVYMRNQEVESQIVKWLDTQMKSINYVNLTNNTIKYKPLTGLKLAKVCIAHLLAK